MNSRRPWSRGLLAGLAGAALVVAACSDDPVGPPNGNGDEHPDPAGVEVTFLGEVIATYMDGGDIPTIELPPNSAFGGVGITFLDAEGDPIELEEDVDIVLDIEDEDVLSWEHAGGPNAVPPHFQVNLQTGEGGQTTVRLELHHGDHVEWDTPDILVDLVEPNGENGENGGDE